MKETVEKFFEHILDVEGVKLLWLLGQETGEKRSFWFTDTPSLVRAIESARDSEYHVYFGMGSRKRDLGPFERGERPDYLQYRALWLDIDVLGPNHSSDRLPPTNKDAKSLVERMPLPPTAVVASGGGIQAYWLLKEVADASELEEFLRCWHATWKAFGEERSWHVDNVFDLGRVMRTPGSINRKNNAPVEILSADWDITYDLSDFEEYLREPEALVVTTRDAGDPERPGDAYNRIHQPDQVEHARKVLDDYGFTPQRPKPNGEMPYVRPGKSGGSSSATIYPDGHVTVYSDDPSLPTTQANKTGKPLDPFGLYVMFVHEGDWDTATKQLREEGFGDPASSDDWVLDDIESAAEVVEPAPSSSWRVFNLFDLADAPEETPPSVGVRTDGVFLLYQGKVHSVFGEPGGMKSWLTQVIGSQVVEGAGYSLIIDFENTKRSLYDRFRYLGVSGDDLRHIDVITPDTPFGEGERKAIEALCREKRYELVVVDGTTDAMVMFSLDPNSATDAARFDKTFLKVLSATGAAVIYVDHVTKDKESRSGWGFGSQHKKSAIDGASFGIEQTSSFGKGMHGKARIIIHKDKPGDLLQHALEGVHTAIAELDLISNPQTFGIEACILPPTPYDNETFRPTYQMGRIATYIEHNPGLSKEVVITGAGLSGAKQDWVHLGFQKLEAEGYIACDLGDGRDKRWRSVKPYDEASDYLDTYGNVTVSKVADEGMERLRSRMPWMNDSEEPGDDQRADKGDRVALEDLL